jgi:hypothetical protein
MIHRSLGCLLGALVFAAACGGEQPEATQPTNPAPSAVPAPTGAPQASATPAATTPPATTAAPSATAAATPPAPTQPGDGDWDKWSHDQKLAWMKAAVMPKMGQAFHDFDGTKYAEAKCVLCHGDGVKDGSFKMPNPALPKLPGDAAGFKKLAKDKPKVVDFMSKVVEIQMASLVGEKPMDPKTGQGFGCFECHTKK